MVIPIDSVEKVTGIDFFPSIPTSRKKKWRRRSIGAAGRFNAYIRKILEATL